MDAINNKTINEASLREKKENTSAVRKGFGKIIGLAFAVEGTYLASLGNIISASNQKAGIPVIQFNAFGMIYGSVAMFLLAVMLGKEISFETSQSYVLSLLYLPIFGSVIAFGAFMMLIGNIGASKAAYVSLIAPVIALTISTFLEDLHMVSN